MYDDKKDDKEDVALMIVVDERTAEVIEMIAKKLRKDFSKATDKDTTVNEIYGTMLMKAMAEKVLEAKLEKE